MKKFSFASILAILLCVATFVPTSASEWDLKNLLNNIGSQNSTENATDTAKTESGLAGLLSGVANQLGIGSSDLTIEKLVGTWKYSNPAVSFASENLLLKAGGSAAATQVETKIAPYYKRVGLNQLVMTIAEDSTFTFKVRTVNLNGVISRNTETGNFVFQFKAFKQINMGAMESNIVMNGNTMELTFDVSNLITIVEKIGQYSGNSTIKGVSTLLNQYDGMNAGFELKRK